MSSVNEWVQRYIDMGMSPLPILPGEKAPKDAAWQKLTYTVGDFDPDSNVGIHLGNGIVDVDLDSPEARAMAPSFLPPTIVFGRAGSPSAHWIYAVKGVFGSIRWNGIGGADDCLLELRGLYNEATGTPTQTVFPPSRHKGTGELIMWEDSDDPAKLSAPFEVDADYIRHRGKLLALATLIARHFPGTGRGHETRMALAGYFFKCGLDEKDIMLIGRVVMKYLQRDEKDWETTGRGTIGKLKADPTAKVSGAGVLKDCLIDGDKVLRCMNRYLGRMEQAAKDDVIDELNARFAVVTVGGTCCVLDDSKADGLTFLTHDNFRKKLAKRTLPAFMLKNGKWKSGEPIADFWLKHADGRHFDTLVYAPPPVEAGPKDYNGWKGLAVSPREGDWSKIYYQLHQVMCRGDEDLLGWLLNWCAALLQKPGQPGQTGIVLKGKQGTGKGFFAEDLLGAMFDRRHFIKMSSSEQFYGRFAGEMLSGRCLVFLDEATWGGDKRDRGILKDRVTSKTIFVDRKGISAINEPSMMHLIIASNEDWIVGLDQDDRRFVVLEQDNAIAQDAKYFDPLYEELRSGGREAFLHAMLAWEVDELLIRRPPRTKAKDELKQRSLSPLFEWIFDRLYTGSFGQLGWPKEVPVQSLYQNYSEWANTRKVRMVSVVEFGRKLGWLFDGKTFLKRAGKEVHRTARVLALPDARNAWDVLMKSVTEWDEPEVNDLQF